MLEIAVIDATIRAVDRANNVVEIETVGWDRPAPETAVPYPVDGTITGRARRVTFQSSGTTIAAIGPDGTVLTRDDVDERGRHEIPDRHNVVQTNGPIDTFFSFDGPATLTQDDSLQGELSFPHPTPVTIGLRSFVRAPRHTVTVPPTPAGLATALSTFASSYVTATPERSSVLSRGHPPRIEYGDEVDVPSEVRRRAVDTGIELRLPDAIEAIVPAASLATYLGAEVSVGDRERPELRVPEIGFERECSPVPAFQFEAASLLRRVFFLDMLVRWVTQSNNDWFEADALSVLDLEPERCREASMGERLRTYLSVDFERASSLFPEWLSTAYVEPTPERAKALPYLAADLTQPFLPSARPDRNPETDRTGPLPRPVSEPGGPYVSWLGGDPLDENFLDGAAIGHPAAYENRTRYLDDPDELRVHVVCNDPDRTDVLEAALAEYRDETYVPTAVSRHEGVSRRALADLLTEGADFVHFIGSCEGGLSCPDGSLSIATLESVPVRSFFLDGPGGRATGIELLEAGSVAGAVWPDDLEAIRSEREESDERDGDEDAVDGFRRRFLHALFGGFTIDLARRYATSTTPGDASVLVLGDGMVDFSTGDQLQVFPLEIEPQGDRTFRVTIHVRDTEPGVAFGGLCLERWQLSGSTFDLTLGWNEIQQLLEARWYLIVYDGELYRPDEVGPFYPLA